MWQAEYNEQLIAALDTVGAVVYRPNDYFDGIIFGIDGGGYDFYASHWIPLRAELIITSSIKTDDDFKVMVAMQKEAGKREHRSGEHFWKCYTSRVGQS